MDRQFRLADHGSGFRNECIGWLTIFLAMAYIILVNPALLADTGVDRLRLCRHLPSRLLWYHLARS